jgi:hypothetical protein
MPEVRGVSHAMLILMVVSIVVPIGLYAAVSWYLREEALRDGMEHVRQTVRMLEEHALRVFEAQQLIIDRVDRYIAGVDWTEIRGSAAVHQYLRDVAGRARMWMAFGSCRPTAAPPTAPTFSRFRRYQQRTATTFAHCRLATSSTSAK